MFGINRNAYLIGRNSILKMDNPEKYSEMSEVFRNVYSRKINSQWKRS